MKITIETTDTERLEPKPDTQSVLRQGHGTGSNVDLVATDGGPPSAELLQSLSDRSRTAATATTQTEQTHRMDLSEGGPYDGGSGHSRH